MIPDSTGAAKAVGKILLDLIGKVAVMVIRILTSNVFIVYFIVQTSHPCTGEEMYDSLKAAS